MRACLEEKMLRTCVGVSKKRGEKKQKKAKRREYAQNVCVCVEEERKKKKKSEGIERRASVGKKRFS